MPSCRVLLAPVLGVLLVLASRVPSESGGPRGPAVPGLSAASGAAAPAVVSLPSSGPGVRTTGRPATGRAVIDTGAHRVACTAGRIVPLVERAGAAQHRTSPEPGDHHVIGPAAGVPPVFTSGPASPGGTAATPPGAPHTAFGARAPPVS